jgi:hypothetical protein
MNPLDGNAIAGALRAVFGREMTMDTGTCAACGRRSPLAEVVVYLLAPGVVARCRECDNLLLVMVERHGMMCVDFSGFSALQSSPAALP